MKNKITILTIFAIIISLSVFSISYIFSPQAIVSAVSFENMRDEGLDDLGKIAYGSEKPPKSATEIVAEIIKYALSFLGIIFLVLILYGGFLWMTAGGNDDKVAQSKTIIINGVIGLIIILSAYAITYFVLENIIKATTGMDH
ncbi:MAG: hypothetical protein V1891_00850 [bacterium]